MVFTRDMIVSKNIICRIPLWGYEPATCGICMHGRVSAMDRMVCASGCACRVHTEMLGFSSRRGENKTKPSFCNGVGGAHAHETATTCIDIWRKDCIQARSRSSLVEPQTFASFRTETCAVSWRNLGRLATRHAGLASSPGRTSFNA